VPFSLGTAEKRRRNVPAKNKSIKMNGEILFVQNGYVEVPDMLAKETDLRGDLRIESLGTIVSNLAHYGFIPSLEATQKIMQLSDAGIYEFWSKVKPALAYVTGEDRNMGDHVVYKNFPKEVLEMDEAQYWINQILMYWGLPNELFTQEASEREPLSEKLKLKVLDLADETTAEKIFNRLCKVPSKWTDFQRAQADYLIKTYSQFTIDMDDFSFKENGVTLVANQFGDVVEGKRRVVFSTSTDVLRLAAALSEGDISLRQKSRFRKFSRPERRVLVNLIDGAKNIEHDFAMRPEQWKRLLMQLHPADFRAERASQAYDKLYNRKVKTLEAAIEAAMSARNPAALDLLKSQPGQFLRRLRKAYDLFGAEAVEAFKTVTGKLTVSQLAKLDGFLRTIGHRKQLIYTPQGNWAKAQIVDNNTKGFSPADLQDLRSHISAEIGSRLNSLYPQGFKVNEAVNAVKLQANGQELAPYGRGTVFYIPEEAKFLRTASYWQHSGAWNSWFDVGWNFYDESWKAKDTVCWIKESAAGKGAIFSGDPTNSKDLKGRACQMIDLYPDKLLDKGIRYAVWSVLCYSNVPFSEAEEVLATLQWGEHPQKGKLYEPGRAQLVFPLTGNSLAKFVAYVDLKERKLVYMDVGMRANVRSATDNEERVGNLMPAFLEYLDSLPSVADVFSHAKKGEIPVLYSDEGTEIEGPAWIFRRSNAENNVEPVNLEEILNIKGDVVSDTLEQDLKFGF